MRGWGEREFVRALDRLVLWLLVGAVVLLTGTASRAEAPPADTPVSLEISQ